MRRIAPWLVALAATLACVFLAKRAHDTGRQLQSLRAESARQARLLIENHSRLSKLQEEYAATTTALTEARAKIAGPGDAAAPDKNKPAMLHMHDIIRDHPEMADIFRKQVRRNVLRQYGDIFSAMNLPSEQMDKLKDLLVEQTVGVMDAQNAALQMGIHPDTPEMQKAVGQVRSDIDKEIKTLLGPEIAPAFNGQMSYALQGAIGDMKDAGVALSADQVKAIVQVSNTATDVQRNPGNRTAAAYVPDPQTMLTPLQQTMLQGAASVLSPAQLQVLKTDWVQQNQEQAVMKQVSNGANNWSLTWD